MSGSGSGSDSMVTTSSDIYMRDRLHPEYVGASIFILFNVFLQCLWFYVAGLTLSVEWCRHTTTPGACAFNSYYLYGNVFAFWLMDTWLCRIFWVFKTHAFEEVPLGCFCPMGLVWVIIIVNIIFYVMNIVYDSSVVLNPGYALARKILLAAPCINILIVGAEVFSTAEVDEDDEYEDMYPESGDSDSDSYFSGSGSEGESNAGGDAPKPKAKARQRKPPKLPEHKEDEVVGEKGNRENYDVPPDAHPFWAKQYIVYKDAGGEGDWDAYQVVAQKQYTAMVQENQVQIGYDQRGQERPFATENKEKQGNVIDIVVPADAPEDAKMKYVEYRVNLGGDKEWKEWFAGEMAAYGIPTGEAAVQQEVARKEKKEQKAKAKAKAKAGKAKAKGKAGAAKAGAAKAGAKAKGKPKAKGKAKSGNASGSGSGSGSDSG